MCNMYGMYGMHGNVCINVIWGGHAIIDYNSLESIYTQNGTLS